MLNNFALTKELDMGTLVWNPGSRHMLYHLEAATLSMIALI